MLYYQGYSRKSAGLVALFRIATLLLAPSAATAASLNLAWDASTSSNAVGYRIYYGSVSGNYTNSISAGNATNATVSGLVAGTRYYFAATAYDSFGVESDYSVETNYAIVTPSNQPPTISSI